MHRLASVCVVLACVVVACSSGKGTGEATLTGPAAPTKSVTASSFDGSDGSGNMVRGWRLDFFEAGPGADCTDGGLKVSATLAIYTSMTADHGKVAMLPSPADIPIVTTNPPTVQGQASATMGTADVGGINGSLHIDTFHLNAKSQPDEIDGSIVAGGTAGQNAVNIMGTFKAPVCD